MLSISSVLLLAVGAAGHGMLTLPPGRNGGNLNDAAKAGDMDQKTFNTSSWFTAPATIPGEATNCGKFVTGIPCGTRDATQPWRAPGTAPVFSPCGGFCMNANVGSPKGCEIGQQPGADWTIIKGVDLPKTNRTVWTAGSSARVAFTALYNHGGGCIPAVAPTRDQPSDAEFYEIVL
jgi:hypothetical protein